MQKSSLDAKKEIITKVIAGLMLPFAMIFAIYVQMHGEISPGGGFQSGVLLASCGILYGLAFGNEKLLKMLSFNLLRILSALGVAIYIVTGLICILKGGNFLEYSKIWPDNPILSQEIGVFVIELGVGLTVFSVMLVLYLSFACILDE